MKKSLCSLAAVLLISPAFAQITLQSSDFASADTKYLRSKVTSNLSAISIGGKGANQVWNFSSLTEGAKDSVIYLLPSEDPDGAKFTSSNLLQINSDSTKIVYTKTSSTLGYDGYITIDPSTGKSVITKLPNTLVFLAFPLKYGDHNSYSNTVFKSTTAGDGAVFDSLRTTVTLSSTDTVDAWGSITTPTGTYSSLRVVGYQITTVQIDAKLVGFPSYNSYKTVKDTSRTYSWYAPNAGVDVLDITLKGLKGNAVTAASYLKGNKIALALAYTDLTTKIGNVYPVPSKSGELFLSDEVNSAATVTLNDLQGKPVYTEKLLNGLSAKLLGLPNGLGKGVYVLSVIGDRSSYSKRVVIE